MGKTHRSPEIDSPEANANARTVIANTVGSSPNYQYPSHVLIQSAQFSISVLTNDIHDQPTRPAPIDTLNMATFRTPDQSFITYSFVFTDPVTLACQVIRMIKSRSASSIATLEREGMIKAKRTNSFLAQTPDAPSYRRGGTFGIDVPDATFPVTWTMSKRDRAGTLRGSLRSFKSRRGDVSRSENVEYSYVRWWPECTLIEGVLIHCTQVPYW